VAFKKEHAKAMLFHDLLESEGERLASLLPKQPLSCFITPNHWDPYDEPAYRGKLGYIFTEADQILPVDVQKTFASSAGIHYTRMLKDSSHSPHLENPNDLAKIVIGLLGDVMEHAAVSLQ
jgi:pimeloyl-ACP methyl ester carboxylesterase